MYEQNIYNKKIKWSIVYEKYKVKAKTSYLRDQMATAVYYLFERHFPQIRRSEYDDIEEEIREKIVADSFQKVKLKESILKRNF